MNWIFLDLLLCKCEKMGTDESFFDDEFDNEEEEFMLDEVSGRKRKPLMSLLNKTKLDKHEMDDLFC
jgi:hypothetical protein